MCGIAGEFDVRGKRPVNESVLARMSATIIHRGPDESGTHVEAGLGLAHRRLSIIDLASGQQPLFNEDRSVAVVYNGEIFNFPALMKELAGAGHEFRTRCDTEVIVHAWEEWGEECVHRFRGQFAFALWDRNKQTLFLARDRLGIKPLYYSYLPDGHLIFGSELKALLAHPGLRRELEPRAVEDYLTYGYIPEPKTILQDAHKLSPGHTLTQIRNHDQAKQREYWDVPFRPVKVGSEEEVGDELMSRLREAVEVRLISEVPLGAFLSGGVDSSAVVATMAGLSSEPVNTCSISFGDPAFNEAPHAALVAERFRTNHRTEEVDPDEFDLVDSLAGLYDEPYADSSALPTYRVCQMARKRVTVALSGDGGDENLAGYRRYRWHVYEEYIRGLLPLGIRGPLFGLLGAVYPKADWAPKVLRAKSTLQAMARDSLSGYYHSVSYYGDKLMEQLLSPGFKRELQGYEAIEVLRHHAERAPDHPLSRIQYLDMKTYLVGDILTKVDRASMAHSLEVRVPLLDHELVEWMSGLPPDLKLRGREGKYIFKKALLKSLPADILYRPKMGFAVPLGSWFRGPLRQRAREAVLGPILRETGIFNMETLTTIVDRHQSGQNDYSSIIWALLMFEAFARRIHRPGSVTPAVV